MHVGKVRVLLLVIMSAEKECWVLILLEKGVRPSELLWISSVSAHPSPIL